MLELLTGSFGGGGRTHVTISLKKKKKKKRCTFVFTKLMNLESWHFISSRILFQTNAPEYDKLFLKKVISDLGIKKFLLLILKDNLTQ